MPTAFASNDELDSGALTYCNAGHDNPYLLRKDSAGDTRLADGAGPPLCALDGFPYASAEWRMQAGDVLCLVTDGVVDAQNPSGERYGSERLAALLSRLQAGVTAQDLVTTMRAEVGAFTAGAEPADDLTVLALRYTGVKLQN